jgi:anti-sigma regulatory factor (Ser/Thr protein kinase)
MPGSPRQNPAVRDFILRNVRAHPADIAAVTSARYGLSRPSVAGYIRRLANEGLIDVKGNTSDRRYTARDLVSLEFQVRLTVSLSEDAVWQGKVLPRIRELPENIVNICQYGFTEMLNNTIDHSASTYAHVIYKQSYSHVNIQVVDRGIGIFQKLQNRFHLYDARQALLELSKGRLTSDPKHHTGHGIFFTSRMFDEFAIYSGSLYYNRVRQDDDDWCVEARDLTELVIGTWVEMTIATNASWTTRDIFDRYQDDPVGFRRTHVPIALGKYPGEQLVSRSQAKRVLARVDRFSEVLLDFQGVQDIGPAFADEIFRVFRNAHPDINIIAARANERVNRMIKAAKEAPIEELPEEQPEAQPRLL